MNSTEKIIRRIIYKHGGEVYEMKGNKIIAEFTCTKNAVVCFLELDKIKVKAARAGTRITATIREK